MAQAHEISLPVSRMRLIEVLLLWEGAVTNYRLRSLLEVSQAYASQLLAAYQEAYPECIQRVKGDPVGYYRAGSKLTPLLTAGRPEEYLAAVGEQLSGVVSVIRANYTRVEPRLYGDIHRSAMNRTGIEITYHSMTRPKGRKRVVFPHALVSIGQRWHARAWDSDREEFRDFNLGRISRWRCTELPSPITPDRDVGWQIHVPLKIQAHRGLSAEQKRVIELEYFNRSAMRRIELRGCLVAYTIQAMRIAIDPDKDKPPDYQLEVANTSEISEWLLSH